MTDNLEDAAVCNNCGSLASFEIEVFREFFAKRRRTCSGCNLPLPELWPAALDFIRSSDATGLRIYDLFAPLRSHTKMFEIVVIPREYTEVELKDNGIPEDALITAITYWALDGFLDPVEVTGWVNPRTAAMSMDADGIFGFPPGLSRSLKRLDLPHHLKILGAEIGSGGTGTTRVKVAVNWLDPDVSEIASEPIFWALEAFSAGRLHAAVMLAQVAAEIKADELYRNEDASYYKQLKELRQTARDSRVGWNRKLRYIYKLMDDLRRRRNGFVHKGRWSPELERLIVAEYLCATVFMVHHLNMLRTADGMFSSRQSTRA